MSVVSVLGEDTGRHQGGMSPLSEPAPGRAAELPHACKSFTRPLGFFLLQRLENVLFGPHDCSHASSDGYPMMPSNGNVEVSGMAQKPPHALSTRL